MLLFQRLPVTLNCCRLFTCRNLLLQTDDHGYNALTISTFCDRAGVAEVLCEHKDTIVSGTAREFLQLLKISRGMPVVCNDNRE